MINKYPKINLGSNVSIGVSAYGNHETTLNCLRSIFAAAEGDFELILVDDFSPDNGQVLSVFQEVKARHPNTKIFAFDENKEYSGSLNAILSHASGDFIFFISNDIYVTPSYLKTLLNVSKQSTDIGIVRGRSNFVDNGKTTHNVPILSPIGSLEDILKISADIEKKFKSQTLVDDYLVGDAFLVKKSVIEKIGTFDTSFFGYFSDQDFGLRAQIAGFKIVLARGAYAFHHQNSNFDYLPQDEKRKKFERRVERIQKSYKLFKEKYGMDDPHPYESINKIKWPELIKLNSNNPIYMPPIDYSTYIKN